MTYGTLTLSAHEGVATVTLNRADAYNAINLQMAVELLEASLSWMKIRQYVAW